MAILKIATTMGWVGRAQLRATLLPPVMVPHPAPPGPRRGSGPRTKKDGLARRRTDRGTHRGIQRVPRPPRCAAPSERVREYVAAPPAYQETTCQEYWNDGLGWA